MNNDLISRSELRKAFKKHPLINDTWLTYSRELIDNAPTVAVNCKECDGYETGYSAGLKDTESPKGDCENCDYRKFTEKFINGFVEGLNKYGIASIEQLSEILGKGEEE